MTHLTPLGWRCCKLEKILNAYLSLEEYIKANKELKEQSVFEYFDFSEVLKIAHTLIEDNKKHIKQTLKGTPFEKTENEAFLGPWFSAFLENSFQSPVQCRAVGVGRHLKEVNGLQSYQYWLDQTHQFVATVPYIASFFHLLKSLEKEQSIYDGFFLNYQLESIDFEAILLSSLVNFHAQRTQNKLGVTLADLKKFIHDFFDKNNDEYSINLDSEKMRGVLTAFAQTYEMDQVDNFCDYLIAIVYEQLSGYEYDELKDEDYAHVGGPVLLKES